MNTVPGGSPSFGRRDGLPNRGFGGRALDRSDNREVGQILEDTVFIQGLPPTASEELLAKHFGVIGALKMDFKTGKPRVWLCRDKETGRPRGDGIVGYEQPQAARIAIERFNRSDFLGAVINVRHASKKPGTGTSLPSTPGTRGKADDWMCPVPNCNNRNFGWRMECNRCKAPRPGGASGDKDAGPLRGAGDARSNDGNLSDPEGSPVGRPAQSRSPESTGLYGDRDLRANLMRGGMRGGGRGGFQRGGGGMGPGSFRGVRGAPGGPMRGGDRFQRRDQPY